MAFVKPIVESLFKKCSDCRFAITRDDGYSNYTVEGTTFNCAKGLHPKAPFDNFYDRAHELYFAENCSGYTKGQLLEIDVEEEVLDNLTPDQQEVLDIERTTALLMKD